MSRENDLKINFLRGEGDNGERFVKYYGCGKLMKDTITYDELPEWYTNNKYIYYGYRKPHMMFRKLFLSIFQIHNETFNIWSHIVGFFMFVTITTYFTITNYHYSISSIPINVFLFGTMVCFINSVVMHTFYPHSKKTCGIVCSLDYSGIFIIIYCGYISFIHYEFFVYPYLQMVYLVYLTILGIFSLLLIYNRRPCIRSSAFLLLGISSLVPIIHKKLFLSKGNNVLNKRTDEGLLYIFLTLIVSLIGILLYVSKLPERIGRDYFNIICTSHNLFHVCTIIAAYLYYTALMELYVYYRDLTHFD